MVESLQTDGYKAVGNWMLYFIWQAKQSHPEKFCSQFYHGCVRNFPLFHLKPRYVIPVGKNFFQ